MFLGDPDQFSMTSKMRNDLVRVHIDMCRQDDEHFFITPYVCSTQGQEQSPSLTSICGNNALCLSLFTWPHPGLMLFRGLLRRARVGWTSDLLSYLSVVMESRYQISVKFTKVIVRYDTSYIRHFVWLRG